MYIYFYIYDMVNKQTKMSQMIQHTKKIGATHQRKDAPTLLCNIEYYSILEHDRYIFITIKLLYKVSRNVFTRDVICLIKQLTSCSDLWHRLRICQKFFYIIIVLGGQNSCHGTTIHAQNFIQSQGKPKGACLDAMAQVTWTLILRHGRIQEQC